MRSGAAADLRIVLALSMCIGGVHVSPPVPRGGVSSAHGAYAARDIEHATRGSAHWRRAPDVHDTREDRDNGRDTQEEWERRRADKDSRGIREEGHHALHLRHTRTGASAMGETREGLLRRPSEDMRDGIRDGMRYLYATRASASRRGDERERDRESARARDDATGHRGPTAESHEARASAPKNACGVQVHATQGRFVNRRQRRGENVGRGRGKGYGWGGRCASLGLDEFRSVQEQIIRKEEQTATRRAERWGDILASRAGVYIIFTKLCFNLRMGLGLRCY
jgi:hypothetical protein